MDKEPPPSTFRQAIAAAALTCALISAVAAAAIGIGSGALLLVRMLHDSIDVDGTSILYLVVAVVLLYGALRAFCLIGVAAFPSLAAAMTDFWTWRRPRLACPPHCPHTRSEQE